MDYETFLPWTIDALVERTFAEPDFRHDLPGWSATITDTDHSVDAGVANFMNIISAEHLMLYYDTVYPDPRIPGMIQRIADYTIEQSRAATATDHILYPLAEWVSAYVDCLPAGVVTASFTATTVNGSPTLTYTGGDIPFKDINTNNTLVGTGLQAATLASSFTAPNLITMSKNATATGSITVTVPMNGWTIGTGMAALFAWVYAYTGTALYATWADRAAAVGNIAGYGAGGPLSYQTKIWGEFFGGAHMSWLYYRNGGTIRGTTGVHPTVITNPPAQPTLD